MCPWVDTRNPAMVAYHNQEWGVPVWEDSLLLEQIALGAVQAGLSWRLVMQRRAAYQAAFFGFDPPRVAAITPEYLETLLVDATLIRNRQKMNAIVNNSRAVCRLAAQHGTFAVWFWQFVGGQPLVNQWQRPEDVPAETPLALMVSKAMKREGFAFAGPKCVYAVMQACGLVNDHLVQCPRHAAVTLAVD